MKVISARVGDKISGFTPTSCCIAASILEKMRDKGTSCSH